jgi:protein SPT2
VGSSGGPGRLVSSPHDLRRPVSGLGPPGRSVNGPGRSVSGSVPAGRTVSISGPGRPVSSLGPGRTVSSPGPPTKPKCTVVSETISSKNIISRSNNGQMNGMRPPLSGYRSAQGKIDPHPKEYILFTRKLKSTLFFIARDPSLFLLIYFSIDKILFCLPCA